jgi:hypothetical protein
MPSACCTGAEAHDAGPGDHRQVGVRREQLVHLRRGVGVGQQGGRLREAGQRGQPGARAGQVAQVPATQRGDGALRRRPVAVGRGRHRERAVLRVVDRARRRRVRRLGEQGLQLAAAALVPADGGEVRHEVRDGVEVLDRRALLPALLGPRLGAVQVTGADGEHHVHHAGEVGDPAVRAVRQGLRQLADPAPGLPVAVHDVVDGLPEQAHQQVAGPLRADALADQLVGQLAAERRALGRARPQQAVVRQAERQGAGRRVVQPGRLLQHAEDRQAPAGQVVALGGQARPQLQAQRRGRVDPPGQVPQPGQHDVARGAALLVHPEAALSQDDARHRRHVVRPLRLGVGGLEPPLDAAGAGTRGGGDRPGGGGDRPGGGCRPGGGGCRGCGLVEPRQTMRNRVHASAAPSARAAARGRPRGDYLPRR